MTFSFQKVYVYGRLRGITTRRIRELAAAKRLKLTRRPSYADAIVLAHSTAGFAVSTGANFALGFSGRLTPASSPSAISDRNWEC